MRRTMRGTALAILATMALGVEARAQAPAGGADRLPAPTDPLLLVVSRTDATLTMQIVRFARGGTDTLGTAFRGPARAGR